MGRRKVAETFTKRTHRWPTDWTWILNCLRRMRVGTSGEGRIFATVKLDLLRNAACYLDAQEYAFRRSPQRDLVCGCGDPTSADLIRRDD